MGIHARAPFVTEPSDDPRFLALQAACFRRSELDDLRASPGLHALLREVFGGDFVAGQGDVVRAVPPSSAPTRPHQDGAYVQRAGVVTAWIPLVDCALELGPLAVDPATFGGPVFPHHEAGLLWEEERLVARDMAVGDVLIFDLGTVHAALPNRSGKLRLSVDLRFAPEQSR